MPRSASKSRRSPSRAAKMDAQSQLPANCTIFYSSANDLDLDKALGARHYSYRFAESHFLAMLEARGIPVRHLVMPEYYGQRAALAAEVEGLAATSAHLIFRSTQEIRLLKCAYNIACFAWEFDVLKDYTLIEGHPFLNQKRMLGICDEIWVPSQYTREVLLAHGLHNVHCIPAPIRLPARRPTERDEALAQLASLTVCPLLVNTLLSPESNSSICASRTLSLGEWMAGRMARHHPEQ